MDWRDRHEWREAEEDLALPFHEGNVKSTVDSKGLCTEHEMEG